MKYTKGQFTAEYYRLWESGLLLPDPSSASVYTIKFRKNNYDEFSKVTLDASSINDALERACYAITYGSSWRPEDIDLHAVYDQEDNLLWVDEVYYDLIQKKNIFLGMDRRSFLSRFGLTSAAILFGIRLPQSKAATTAVTLGGDANGFGGEQIYTSAGVHSWTVPAGVTTVSVVCVGGGGGGGFTGSSTAAGLNACAGGGGGLRYITSYTVTPGASISVTVGSKGLSAYSNGYTGANNTGQGSAGGSSIFGSTSVLYAGGGGGGSANPTLSGGGVGGTGIAIGGAIGGGNGGSGGGTNTGDDSLGWTMRGGGGGAGGYSGNGGVGGNGITAGSNGGSGSGGAGGGGASGNALDGAGIGGGTGLYGSGANGTGGIWKGSTSADGSTGGRNGQGGSGGSGGQSAAAYGGGGEVTDGRPGAVRIIWGPSRSFPNNAS